MAFTQPEIVAIRHWMGASALFHGFYPLLESAIQTVQSVADGGNQPDNSTELAIRAVLAELMDIETKRKSLRKRTSIDTAETGDNKARIDPGRGLAILRGEGRVVARGLALYLGFSSVLADVFSPGHPHVPSVVGPDLLRSS